MNLGILVGIEFESLTTLTEGMCRDTSVGERALEEVEEDCACIASVC